MALTGTELENMVGKTMELVLVLWGKQLLFNETLEFLIMETAKIQCEDYRNSKKTPWKRIEELELMMKGMNAYYQEQLAELRHLTPPLKKDKYTYDGIKND